MERVLSLHSPSNVCSSIYGTFQQELDRWLIMHWRFSHHHLATNRFQGGWMDSLAFLSFWSASTTDALYTTTPPHSLYLYECHLPLMTHGTSQLSMTISNCDRPWMKTATLYKTTIQCHQSDCYPLTMTGQPRHNRSSVHIRKHF